MMFQFLSNDTLGSVQLSNHQSIININSGEQISNPDQNTGSHTEDTPPDYNTVIDMKNDDDNLPTYLEAVATNTIN